MCKQSFQRTSGRCQGAAAGRMFSESLPTWKIKARAGDARRAEAMTAR